VGRQVEAQKVEYSDLVSRLPGGTAAIDFVRSTAGDLRGARYDAFVRRPAPVEARGQVAWVALGLAEPIDRAIRSWRYRLAAGRGLERMHPPEEPKRDDTPERTVRHLIWDRLEPGLAGFAQVVIIPDAAIARIPGRRCPAGSPATCCSRTIPSAKVATVSISPSCSRLRRGPGKNTTGRSWSAGSITGGRPATIRAIGLA
jgi:hypothetical protein